MYISRWRKEKEAKENDIQNIIISLAIVCVGVVLAYEWLLYINF